MGFLLFFIFMSKYSWCSFRCSSWYFSSVFWVRSWLCDERNTVMPLVLLPILPVVGSIIPERLLVDCSIGIELQPQWCFFLPFRCHLTYGSRHSQDQSKLQTEFYECFGVCRRGKFWFVNTRDCPRIAQGGVAIVGWRPVTSQLEVWLNTGILFHLITIISQGLEYSE